MSKTATSTPETRSRRTFDFGEFLRIEGEMIFVKSKLRALATLFECLESSNDQPKAVRQLGGLSLVIGEIIGDVERAVYGKEQAEADDDG